MLKMKRSRTMPALLTMQSMRPKLSSAACTILCAESHSATLSTAATACPPASLISSTTDFGQRLAAFLVARQVVDHHLRAVRGERLREVAPDAGTGAGHDHDLVLNHAHPLAP